MKKLLRNQYRFKKFNFFILRIRQIIHIMDLLFVAKNRPMDKVCAPKLTFMPFAPCF